MILFDTSVLIAAMVSTHSYHKVSFQLLQKVHDKHFKGAISLHGLAECYSVLTALPLQPRISPVLAEKLISENILSVLSLVELGAKDYRSALHRVSSKNLKSGIIFDALIFQAALKAKATALCTWNESHFKLLLGDEDLQICNPTSVDEP